MRSIEARSYGAYTKKIVDKWLTVFPVNVPTPGSDPRHRLGNVLEAFKIFAEGYAQIVEQMAKEEESYSEMNLGRQDLFDKWLKDQIGKALDIYWAPLSQIASQYVAPPYCELLSENQDLEDLINRYLQSINDLVGIGNLQLPGILVFFDEITLIHYYPYSDVALVSLPYRVFEDGDSREVSSSIAHELGHYLYWHMADFRNLEEQHQKLLNDLEEKFIQVHDKGEWLFVGPWVEEIFADIVGAWIGGEDFFLSSKDMVRRKVGFEPEKWTANDNQHVVDVLRPFIASYTLEKRGVFSDGVTKWKNFLDTFSGRQEDLVITVNDVNEEDIPDQPPHLENGTIKLAAGELIPALQFVVDYLITNLQKFSNNLEGSVQFVFSAVENLDSLKSKAKVIAGLNPEGSQMAYKILLQPVVLEAAGSGTKHQHTFYTFFPHYHKEKPKSHKHS